ADLEPLCERFFAALADDFNTPRALAALYEWISEANKRDGVGDAHARAMLRVLGLENLLDATADGPDAEAQGLLDAREAARAARDWPEADRLRDALAALGWEVRDGAGGPELVRP
ncbi:MAG TPA: DALR domain-containing protein, partial [Coriobacteriia bacterium]